MNADAQVPVFLMIALAIGAGLLAVFVLWVSKQIANPDTRSRGITAAAVAVGVLVLGLGFFVTGTTLQPQVHVNAPATPMGPTGGAIDYQLSVDSHSRIEVAPPHESVRGEDAVGMSQSQPAFIVRKLVIAAIVITLIVLVASSKKGLVAALSGLGILAVILSMYLFAARHVQVVPEVAQRATDAPSQSVPWSSEAVELDANPPPSPQNAVAVAEKTSTSAKAEPETNLSETTDDKSAAERNVAEATPTTEKDDAKNPPPAWVSSEPTMEAGEYRVAVVSGPYSTKQECEVKLDEPLRRAVQEYARIHLQPSARMHALAAAPYIRNELIEERYVDEQEFPFGKMYNLHVLVRIDQSAVAKFNALGRQSDVRRAVETTSIGGAWVLAALAALYGGLRFAGRKKPAVAVSGSPEAPAEPTA